MKKVMITILISFSLILSACSNTSSSTGNQAATAESASASSANTNSAVPSSTASVEQEGTTTARLDSSYENAAPIALQLLVGTYKLAGTDQAVTADQAKTLLPLWNEYKTLTMNSMPAPGSPNQGQGIATPTPRSLDAETQAQIDGLVSQIQAAMTPGQIQAIAAMKITQDTAMNIVQGMGMPAGGQPPSGAPANAAPPSGTPPSGSQASSPPAGGAGMLPPGVLDALIQMLQNTSTGQTSSSTIPSQAGTAASSSSSNTTSAAYTLDSGSQSLSGQSYTADGTDESGVYVTSGASLTLSKTTVSTSGNSSSSDNSSFHGLNAAVLVNSASSLLLSNSKVVSSGSGANGVFAEGAGTSINLENVTITATGQYAHAVMATNGGILNLTQVDMSTSGANSAAIATDRGGGTIIATGGTVTTSGTDSPGIYSTGDITVSQADVSATGSEAAVIEGSNSIQLIDTQLSAEKKWGVMIYQSMSGDAQGVEGTFNMSGGSLSAAVGPLFYVTNSTGIITLKGVQTSAASGLLIDASAGNWGTSGSNGGNVQFTADGQTLTGDIQADNLSTVALTLQNSSTLTGAINSTNTAKSANLSLDASSTWNVTADSYLTCLSDPAGISGTNITNINGNGHTVYYLTNACSDLGGQTFSLNGGGTLEPAS